MSAADLIIDCISWNESAENALSIQSLNCSVLDIKKQVNNDLASLFQISIKNEIVGYYVLRIDEYVSGNVGVVVAMACVNQGVDMTALLDPVISKQFKNCVAMRVHTARAGLVKKLSKLGYMPQEFVMKKALNV